MKTAGIIGGIGPESTVAYYRHIISLYRERRRDKTYPHLIINSIDMTRMMALSEEGRWGEMVDCFSAEIGNLARAGADFALIACNTPHYVFDDLKRLSPIPLISIVEAVCAATKARGLKRVGLFGTRFTMAGDFFGKVFSREGITLVIPNETEQAFIHEKYMEELVQGVFLSDTREDILTIVDRLKEEEKIDGLILGGTELTLLLPDVMYRGIPFLDTMRIHVGEIVDRLLS